MAATGEMRDADSGHRPMTNVALARPREKAGRGAFLKNHNAAP